MILATPIFYPVIIKLGYDPIWFGMMIAITVMIGVVIPPVAINVFVVKNITKVPLGRDLQRNLPLSDQPDRLRRPAFLFSPAGPFPSPAFYGLETAQEGSRLVFLGRRML